MKTALYYRAPISLYFWKSRAYNCVLSFSRRDESKEYWTSISKTETFCLRLPMVLVYPGLVARLEKNQDWTVVQFFQILNWKTDTQLVFLASCRLVTTDFAWLSDSPLNYLQNEPKVIKFGWKLSKIYSKHIFSKHITMLLIVSHSILVQFAWFLAHFMSLWKPVATDLDQFFAVFDQSSPVFWHFLYIGNQL